MVPWKKQEPADTGSFKAERAGFEPAVGFYPYAALAKRCFRPLSHLSKPLEILVVSRFSALGAFFAVLPFVLPCTLFGSKAASGGL